MLRNSYGSWEETLVHKTEGYLHDAFGMSCKLEPYRPQSLPYFVGDQYRLWCSDLFGRPCLFMAPTPDAAPSVDEMVRHVELVRSRLKTSLVILLFDFLTPARRRALLARRVAFLAPRAQLFVPDVLLDLRERTSRPPPHEVEQFSPTAQMIILGVLLKKETEGASATALARRYGVAIMSVTRAFDELEAAGLAKAQRVGRQRELRFQFFGRELWDMGSARLRSPVRKVRTVIIPYPERFPGRIAGESALSHYTSLAASRTPRLAVASADWNQLARDHGLRETDPRDPEGVEVETWAYAPAALASGVVVDPLSLYLSVRRHPDERVGMAADELLETFAWL